MYKLVEEASKVLRTPPEVFDFENPPESPELIAEKMSEAMDRFGGMGLSANQVGLPYRMFVMKTMVDGETVNKPYFNPELVRVSQETDLMKEGCLSFPDMYLMIKRSSTIELKYQDVEGKEHTVMLEGIGARCVQHEVDHLNGIIFLQRASRLKIERALKARPKEKRKREEYEARIAYARALQEHMRAKDAESADTGEVSDDDSVVQESQTSS